MDAVLKFIHDKDTKQSFWWSLSEICPEGDRGNYLRKIPHSSCLKKKTNISRGLDLYNIYIFSDRRSNLLGDFYNEG